MSTKVTIAYDKDFHLYWDYADMDIHLEINGKEIKLPPRLRAWINTMWELSNTLESLWLLVDAIQRGDYCEPLGAVRELKGEGETDE